MQDYEDVFSKNTSHVSSLTQYYTHNIMLDQQRIDRLIGPLSSSSLIHIFE